MPWWLLVSLPTADTALRQQPGASTCATVVPHVMSVLESACIPCRLQMYVNANRTVAICGCKGLHWGGWIQSVTAARAQCGAFSTTYKPPPVADRFNLSTKPCFL